MNIDNFNSNTQLWKLVITWNNYENNEIIRILIQNYENHENSIIPRQNN